MDVRYINPFLSGAVEVLGTMAMVQLTPGKPFLKKAQEAMGDVSGIVGMSGGASGSLSVTFTFPVLQAVMRNMLGEEVETVNADVKDAVGELTNMISGSARKYLQEEGLTLSAGVPTVVAGKDHSITHAISGPVLVIPFECPHGKVIIEVAMIEA